MAASIDNCDFYVHAEFTSLLKVANICVSSVSMASVVKVICEATQIIIVTCSTMNSEIALTPPPPICKTAILKWPPCVRLLPDTCSQLKCTTKALTLRCQYDSVQTDEMVTNKVCSVRAFERIVCCSCGNNLMSVYGPRLVRNRVDVSATGLPLGSSWESMDLSYFCHDHDHGDHEESNDHGILAMTSFSPRIDEYFDDAVHVVFNNAVLDHDRMVFTELTGYANCLTCHKHIGHLGSTLKESRELKFYTDAVGCTVNDASCDELVILANILKSYHKGHRRLCLLDASLHAEPKTSVLLLSIMDDNLKTFRSAVSGGVASMKTVWKLLYRTEVVKSDESVIEQRVNGSTETIVFVRSELLAKIGRALTKITRDLPVDWRFADKFCVAYIQKFD